MIILRTPFTGTPGPLFTSILIKPLYLVFCVFLLWNFLFCWSAASSSCEQRGWRDLIFSRSSHSNFFKNSILTLSIWNLLLVIIFLLSFTGFTVAYFPQILCLPSLILGVEVRLIILRTSLFSDSKESACNVGYLGSILGQKDPLEKGMPTHSSILACRIP